MNRRSITASFIAAGAFLIASATAVAAEPSPAVKSAGPTSGMGDMSYHRSMMEARKDSNGSMGDGGMKGMMGMMHSCQSMMGNAKGSDNPMTLQLPPGNEKLEFQMHAEMMQKMGEIAAKYADKIKDAK